MNKSEKSKSPMKYNEYDIDIDRKPDFFNLCPIAKKEKKKQKLNNIKIYKSPFSYISSQSSNMYNAKKKTKNPKSVYTSKSKFKDENKNYYKIFFILLLKSIIINNKVLENFQKNDFESLYEECQKEQIPFNQYQEWLTNKINLNSNNDNKENYIEPTIIDSTIVDCFICSSMI